MRIYVSSTSWDLKDHREAVIISIKRLGHEPVAMEYYVASPTTPVEKCLKDVAGCDFYVGIFAWRYGFIPGGYEQSITELEYREAEKRSIPRLVFLLDEKASWDEEKRDKDQDGEKIAALRKELQNKFIVSFFESPDDLAAKATAALSRAIQEARCLREEREHIVGLRFYDTGETFRDRVEEIEDLRGLLKDQSTKLICIVGRGGMGKTALISKLCEEVERGELRLSSTARKLGADGIIYVSCNAVEKPTLERIVHDVAKILDKGSREELLRHWKDPSCSLVDRVKLFLGKIQNGCYLFVLDNIEDLLAQDNSIVDNELRVFIELSMATPNAVKIMTTGRRSMTIEGPGAHRGRDFFIEKGLPEHVAVALLRDLDPQGVLRLKNASDEILSEVSRRCFGLPRALELITGLLRKRTTLSLKKLLSDDKLFNETVVENLAAYLYEQMSEEQRHALQALAVYKDPVGSEALSFLLEPYFPDLDFEACLEELVQICAVTFRCDVEDGIYQLHPIDQHYAYSKIPDGEEGFTKKNCHIRAGDYFLRVSESIRNGRSLDREHLILWSSDELAEWSKNIKYAIEHYHEISAWNAIIGIHDFIKETASIPGFDHSYRRRLGIIMINAGKIAGNKHIEAYWLHEAAVSSFIMRSYDEAEKYCREGLAVAESMEDYVVQGHCLHRLAFIRQHQGTIEEAKDLLMKAALVKEKSGRPAFSTGAWINYATLLESEGELESASEKMADSLSGFKSPHYELINGRELARVRLKQGDTDSIIPLLDQSLETARQHKYEGDMIKCFKDYAKINIYMEKYEDALIQLQEAHSIAERIVHFELLPETHHFIGLTYHHHRNLEKAHEHYCKSIHYNYPVILHYSHVLLGIICLEMKRVEEAAENLSAGIKLCDQLLQKSPRLYEVRSYYALAFLASHRPEEALIEYRKTLEICSAKGVVRIMLQELGLLRRATPDLKGLQEVSILLEEALRKAESMVKS